MNIIKKDASVIMAHFIVSFIALALGGLAGLFQVLLKTGQITLPFSITYYQLLTVHGVLLALVLTTFFIFGFMISAVCRTSGSLTSKERISAWIGFTFMTIGTVMASIMILLNKATVLYTFYAPLQAHWIFYIGLLLLFIGTWFDSFTIISRYRKVKKKEPTKASPLLTYMAFVNTLIWIIASLGVMSSLIFQLIPWSLGMISTVNVALTRTLFWYFGHPLVYFWLLSAYMCWYVIIPKIMKWKLFSDFFTRFGFLLFLVFSFPVGLHHQLADPGIHNGWKFLHVILTFAVVIPSLMTAFSLFATFETFGRSKGSKGLFGWWKYLPWKDARFTVPFIGMLAFIPGGAGGIVNASQEMNRVVHNTTWITGHFHLTISTTVVLTLFGIMYWLVPHLTGRVLTSAMNKLALLQGILWAIGMTIMSTSMHIAGLLGAPRRSAYSDYGGAEVAKDWIPYQIAQAVGGTILFISIILVLIIFVYLAFFAPKGLEEYPVAVARKEESHTPLLFENWKIWISISVFLIIVAYLFPVLHMIQHAPTGSSGFQLW